LAALSVSASGSLPLSYQWQFNGNSIPGAFSDSLRFRNIAPADFGAYRVIVSNAFGSVTSANAMLQLDSDGDGLADSWEIIYFGSITNQSGAFDRDNDGVSNVAEFREGSNPTNATSFFPRLTVQAYRCSVEISPLLERYTNGQTVLLTAVPHAGQLFIQWTGATNSSSPVVTVTMTANKSATAQAGLPLSDSLDITNRVNTGGDVAWFGQPGDTKDGVDAARSGRMVHNQVSWFQLTNQMSGEGTVSFWWKVASQQSSDYLRFLINGAQKPGQISGFTDWHQKTFYLTSGVPIVRWEYLKNQNDGSISDGITLNSKGGTNAFANGPYPGVAPADAGWVDQLVFEVYADPLRDNDGDGMADLWEYRHFYSLDQDALNDPDNDAISNLDEFLEGTDPTSNASLKPRLTLLSEGTGTVSALPSKLKYNYGESVTNSAVPAVNNFFVMWTGAIFDTNEIAPLKMFGNRTIKGVFGFALDQALEAPSLVWTRGGAAGWYGQTNVSHDGVDAGRSAPVNFGQESWMETTVNGPGVLSFWWKVSSLANLNMLRLNLNGIEQSYRISGEVDWEEQFHAFGPGNHTLRWRFVRSNYDPTRDDAGWVDQVAFTPGDVVPFIRSQPSDRTAFQGSNVTLSASAVGTPTLLYEWLRNGTSISLASTNASLTITNITLAQSGSGYAIRVSNAGGATTGVPFAITVLPVPPVNDHFASRSSIAGPTNRVSGYNLGATKEAGEPAHASSSGVRSVWYSWTAPQTATYRMVAEDPKAVSALLLGVYSGNAVAGLTEVGSDSDSGTFTNGAYLARASVLFNATVGTTYAIAVDTSFGSGTSFTLTTQLITAPANDAFVNRTFFAGSSVTVFGNNLGATREPDEPRGGFIDGVHSVWWAWTAPRTGTATATWTGSSFSPLVSIFTGNALTSLTLGTNNAFSLGTSLPFQATEEVTYVISVDAVFGSAGDIVLNLAMVAPSFTANLDPATGEPSFALAGVPGSDYVIQTSTDLVIWESLAVNRVPLDGILRLQGTFHIGSSVRYYRAVLPQPAP